MTGSGSSVAEVACILAALAIVLLIIASVVVPKVDSLERSLGLVGQVTQESRASR